MGAFFGDPLRLILLSLLSFYLSACAQAATKAPVAVTEAKPAPAAVGADAIPAFELKDQHGKVWTPSDADSRPVLVDLWATWCAPCLQALPDLQRFQQAHGAKIPVLGIAFDQQGWPVVRPVLKRYQLAYAVTVAGPELSQAFKAKSYPALVLLHQGKVVLRLKGRHNYQDLVKALQPWLK
jgi:thiol-disulfide isomerase/thioredoxin